MALISSLKLSFLGIKNTENQLSQVANNITNADVPGYRRKSYETQLITTNIGTLPVRGVAVSAEDIFLDQNAIEEVSILFRDTAFLEVIESYSFTVGTTDSGNTLSSRLSDVADSFLTVAANPESSADKQILIDDARILTDRLEQMRQDTQAQRLQAEKGIEQSIKNANTLMLEIAELNRKIVSQSGTLAPQIAGLEDERLYKIEQLAQEMDITWFSTETGQINIYQSGGQPMVLGNNARTINFEPRNLIDPTMIYAAGGGSFDPIDLNGFDITTQIRGGRIAGYVQGRDNYFPDEYEKLVELSAQIRDQVNAQLNQGTAYPPPVTISSNGPTTAGAPGDPFAGNGFLRVFITDPNGATQGFQDFDLSTYGTNAAVVAAINGSVIGGVTVNASLTATGELTIGSADPNFRIGLRDTDVGGTDTSVGPDGRGFQHYFELQSLFVEGDTEPLQIAENYINDPDSLATGVILDTGIFPGNNQAATDAANIFTAGTNFNAAGNFAAQSNSLNGYSDRILSDVAIQIRNAENNQETNRLVLQQTQDLLSSRTQVNIDEETANLIELENTYQAAATVVQKVQDMFDSLLAAVRR